MIVLVQQLVSNVMQTFRAATKPPYPFTCISHLMFAVRGIEHALTGMITSSKDCKQCSDVGRAATSVQVVLTQQCRWCCHIDAASAATAV